ncbi:UNVERIFIED_CONTAM: Retrovirus-related Pol polyprotein from transposon RE1 [Sesamum radiatum]|uniref:Retrovirus-related Pol polyprotein from transposon RE1 n=1 Tax=Sesamum radiatum TaxID=300843 RepID=A0AAW2SLV2_SESRA
MVSALNYAVPRAAALPLFLTPLRLGGFVPVAVHPAARAASGASPQPAGPPYSAAHGLTTPSPCCSLSTPSSPGAFIASHSESWVIDSGATSHLTGNRSHFLTFSTSPKFLPIRLADGSYSPISGSGTVQPTAYLTLTNVLFAPKFPDLQTRRTIGTGHERGGLYFLDTTPHIDARALSASVSPLQWHSRLGHPSLPTLQKILPIDSARLECESCKLEKCFGLLMPSTVLNGDTLYSCLFPDKPLFGIAPRVFGCVCFVHIHSPSLDKLSPRSVKCIFLGYSRTQKGYRCYDPQSRRSFTFADVTFFKFTPFYSPQSSVVIPPPSVPLPVPTLSVPPHTEPPIRPLQVYSRRNRSTNTTLIVPPDLPPTAALGNPSATPANDLPIALWKGKRSCIAHPLANFLSFQNLNRNYRAFSVSFSSVSIPNTYCEALRHPAWKIAMDDEMSALISMGTWELVEVPPNADIVAYRWVFTLKFRANGTLERYKARLVAKGFTQTYGVDYFETFSPVARLNSIHVLVSLAVNLNWPMYQMDIKNAFLYGDLNETVYMEQPPGYVAQGEKQRMVCKLKKAIYGLKQSPRAWFDKSSRIIGEFGFSRCQADHSVFVQTTKTGMVVLAVYVDDILITGSDIDRIEEAKTYLQKHFVTKDLGRPRYFLGIEIAHSKHGVSLSQGKYACDLLQEAGLLGTKPVDTPMDSNPNFWNDDGNYLEDKAKYRRLVGKLIYLTVTRPDISFAVGLVSQFMDKP